MRDLEPSSVLRAIMLALLLSIASTTTAAQSSSPDATTNAPGRERFSVARVIGETGGETARPLLCRWEAPREKSGNTLVVVDCSRTHASVHYPRKGNATPLRSTWIERRSGVERNSIHWNVGEIDPNTTINAIWLPDFDGDGEDDVLVHCAATEKSPRLLLCVSTLKGTPIWRRELDPKPSFLQSMCWLRSGDDVVVAMSDSSTLPTAGEFQFADDDGEATLHLLRARDGSSIAEFAPKDAGSRFGFSMATVDDLDADGVEDLLIGSPNWKGAEGRKGRAVLFSTKRGAILREVACGAGMAGWSESGVGANVGVVPDLDGDGKKDYVVLVPSADRDVTVGQTTSSLNRAFLDVVGSKSQALVHRLEIPDDQDRPESFGRCVFAIWPTPSTRTPCFVVAHSLATGPTGGNGAMNLYDDKGTFVEAAFGSQDGEYLGDPVCVTSDPVTGTVTVCAGSLGKWNLLTIRAP